MPSLSKCLVCPEALAYRTSVPLVFSHCPCLASPSRTSVLYGLASAAYIIPPQVWTHRPPSLSLLGFPFPLTPAVFFSLIFPTLLCLAALLSHPPPSL